MFRKATKAAARLRLAFIGPAGSGKTYNALLLAKHMGGKVAVIDTERGSASKYADAFDFDVLELEEFHPKHYVEAIKAAEEAGYGVVVIDSLSHAWIGKGGALDLHDQAVDRQKGSKNTFTAWRDVTPHHMALVEAMVQSRCHVIGTVRSKTEYVQEKDEKTGKTSVRKVGMAPVQRDGLEYEFDVVGDLDIDHVLVVSKTRCPALAGKVFRDPGNDLAAPLLGWLSGSPAPERPAQASAVAAKAAKPANGTTPARKPPANGKELLERLEAKEAELVRDGLIPAGLLIAHVRASFAGGDIPEDVAEWGPPYQDVFDVVRAFVEAAQRPPEGNKPASAMQLALLDVAVVTAGVEWKAFAAANAVPADRRKMTAGEVARALDYLQPAKAS